MKHHSHAILSAWLMYSYMERMSQLKDVKLELYTRPTCSDCHEGKAFLAEHQISYTNNDLSEQPEKEKTLRKLTQTRMVPAFVFKDEYLLGKWSTCKVFIGLENNMNEIKNKFTTDLLIILLVNNNLVSLSTMKKGVEFLIEI